MKEKHTVDDLDCAAAIMNCRDVHLADLKKNPDKPDFCRYSFEFKEDITEHECDYYTDKMRANPIMLAASRKSLEKLIKLYELKEFDNNEE